MSAIDKLFDENNNDNIILYNEKGEATEFEQVALIPIDEQIYAILSLANPTDEIGADEGIVFRVEEAEDGNNSLKLVTDDETVDKVFEIYESLLDELDDEDEDDDEDSDVPSKTE